MSTMADVAREAGVSVWSVSHVTNGARRVAQSDSQNDQIAPPLREAAMSAFAQTAAPLLDMRGVTKSFGGAQALRGVDFDLKRGEIHALLGENGAGKSTLMNILSGVIAPDGGEMLLDGEAVRFADPRAAQAAGVATIFQELDLVPSLDVTANLFSAASSRAAACSTARRCATGRVERLERVGDRHRRRPARRRTFGWPPPGRRHRQGADLRLAHPRSGRADRGADRGRGRAPVRADARDRRARRRHRLYLAPAGGGAAGRRPGDGVSRRPGRRAASPPRRNRSWWPARRPAARRALSASAGRRSARRCCGSTAPRFRPTTRARAGRRRRTSASTCAQARSSASPASWARAAPNYSRRSMARRAGGRWSRRVEIAGEPAPDLNPRARAARASASSPTTGAAAGSMLRDTVGRNLV